MTCKTRSNRQVTLTSTEPLAAPEASLPQDQHRGAHTDTLRAQSHRDMSVRPADDVMSLKLEESPIAKGATPNALATAFGKIVFLSLLGLSGAKLRHRYQAQRRL